MKRWIQACAVVAVAALTACAVTEKDVQDKGVAPLSDAQLRTLFAQPVVFNWSSPQGAQGSTRTEPDGRSSVQWPGGGSEGRYRIADGLFCSQYPGVANGVERCARWYPAGEGVYQVFRDGQLSNTVRMVKR